MWHMHKEILVLKTEILICGTTRMNPEDTMLSKRSQLQKGKYCIIQLT